MKVETDLTRTGAYLKLGTRLSVRIPDPTERTPPDWWHIEAITSISAERIVQGWKTEWNAKFSSVETWIESVTGNAPLEDTVAKLRADLEEYDDDAFSSVAECRREIVRKQLDNHTPPRFPTLFTRRLDETIPRTHELLLDIFDETIFRVAGERRPMITAIVRTVEGRAMIDPVVDERIARGILARAIRYAKPGPSRPPKWCNPPSLIAGDLTAYPAETWPVLDAIVRVPAMRRDGTILRDIGYDRATKVWYQPDDVFRDVFVPDNPSPEEIDRARSDLYYPFHKFPWVDGPAPILAIIFERVMMPLLEGCLRPLYIIDAPARGSGKSLAARTVGIIIKGIEPSADSWPLDEEEQDKRITSFLRDKTEEIHVFDDVGGTIASHALSRLLTMFHYRGRILGESNAPALRNLASWLMTLNNAMVDDNIARRCVFARIDAKMRDPSIGRVFDFDPALIAMKHRARLVEAALTIVRAWICAGSPIDASLEGTMGTFEGWLRTVGAVLTFAGIPGLRTGILIGRTRKAYLEDDRELVAGWIRAFGRDTPLKAEDVVILAERLGLYEEIIAKPEKPGAFWRARRLANEVLPRVALKINDRFWSLLSPEDMP